MLVRDEDLTAAARIRNAALEGFALRGVAATSIRDVAVAAGVSPGLVQHHFKTKADLRRAVDDYVVEATMAAFAGLDDERLDSARVMEEIAKRVTGMVRDHRLALLYVARSATEGDEASLRIFDLFMEVARSQVERLDADGLLRDDLDHTWVALHLIVLNLGTVLLEPAIDRHLEAPFRSPDQIERWNDASTQLFRQGALRR